MFFMFGSFCALMALFAYVFIPETKGLSLEKMDELFGASQTLSTKLEDADRRGSVQEVHAEKA